MGYKDREIEIKMVVQGTSRMKTVTDALDKYFDSDSCERIIDGSSKDVYFKPPKGAKADFMRVRFAANKSDQSYFTIKYTDRGSNIDRVEKDVPVGDAELMVSVLTDIHGPQHGEIYKKYKVYFLSHDDTVSVYQIKGDDRVFVEVEATTEVKMQKFLKETQACLPYELVRSTKSLYQMFLGDQK